MLFRPNSSSFTNPMTTTGDIIYSSDNSGTGARLGIGTNGQALVATGGSPAWGTPATGYTYTAQTTNYGATINDLVICSSSDFTVTLPDASAAGNTGKSIEIRHGGNLTGQNYTIATTSSQTITGDSTYNSGDFVLKTRGEVLQVTSNGANWIITGRYAMTTWSADAALTIKGTTADPVKGNSPTTDKISWRRVGPNIEVRGEFKNSTATGSSAGSGDYLFSVPASLTIDLTKVSGYSTTVGTALYEARGIVGTAVATITAGSVGLGYMSVYGATQTRILQNTIGGSAGAVNSGLYALSNATQAYGFFYSVPISGFQP